MMTPDDKYLLDWEKKARDLDREETRLYVKSFAAALVLIAALVGLAVLMFSM